MTIPYGLHVPDYMPLVTFPGLHSHDAVTGVDVNRFACYAP